MRIPFRNLDTTTAVETTTEGLINDNGGVNTNVIIGRILSIITTLGFYAGIVIVALAAFNIIMSFKEQDPERQQKGIILAIVGVALMALGTILGFIFNGSGFAEYITYSIF